MCSRLLSHVAAVRLIDDYDLATDVDEAKSLSHQDQIVEISSNSWGPPDDGDIVSGPGAVTKMALADSAAKVSLSHVFVWE